MVGAVFSNAFLNKCTNIHSKILSNIKLHGRGVYIISMVSTDKANNIKDEVHLLFISLNDLKAEIRSRDNQLEKSYSGVVFMAEKHDIDSHYYLAFTIDKKLIGSSLIPLNHPEELEHSLNNAIAFYKAT